MGVARSRNVLCRASILKSDDCLVNHLTGVATDDPGAQKLVRFGARKDLNHAIWLVVGPRAAVSLERENALDVGDALLLELFLGEADVGDLWIRVDDAWNGSVVDVAAFAAELLDGGDAFLLCLVSEHWSSDDVADGVDVWLSCLPVTIDLNLTEFIGFQACLAQVEAVSEWPPANTEKHDISLQVLLSLGILDHELDALLPVVLTADELGAQHEFQTLFSQYFLELGRDLFIQGGANSVSELNDLDSRAKSLVH